MKVFPMAYIHNTTGIRQLLRIAWAQALPYLLSNEEIFPYLLEVVASLERAYAYAFNGNAKMLTSLMKPLALQESLLEYGMPSISDIFVSIIQGKNGPVISVNEANWPIKNNMPLLASARAMQLTYNEEHQMVSAINL
jgi:hypothetical protein